MSVRDDLIEHLASLMYEDYSGSDWHHVNVSDKVEFRSLASTKVDACRAEVRREVLREVATKISSTSTTKLLGDLLKPFRLNTDNPENVRIGTAMLKCIPPGIHHCSGSSCPQ